MVKRSDSAVMMLVGAVKRINMSESSPVKPGIGNCSPANAPTSNCDVGLYCRYKVWSAVRPVNTPLLMAVIWLLNKETC